MSHNVVSLFESSVDTTALSAKQKAVLKASLTLFADQGYEATSTADIAELAGVAEGTVYKVFKTKAGLLAAIMQPFIQQVLPQVLDEFIATVDAQPLPDLKTALTFMIKDRLAFALANRKEVKVFAQIALRDPKVLAALEEELGDLIGHYQQVLGPLQAAGELVAWPAGRILRYVFGTVVSYLLPTILLDAPTPDLEAVTAECVEFLARGLAAGD